MNMTEDIEWRDEWFDLLRPHFAEALRETLLLVIDSVRRRESGEVMLERVFSAHPNWEREGDAEWQVMQALIAAAGLLPDQPDKYTSLPPDVRRFLDEVLAEAGLAGLERPQ